MLFIALHWQTRPYVYICASYDDVLGTTWWVVKKNSAKNIHENRKWQETIGTLVVVVMVEMGVVTACWFLMTGESLVSRSRYRHHDPTLLGTVGL